MVKDWLFYQDTSDNDDEEFSPESFKPEILPVGTKVALVDGRLIRWEPGMVPLPYGIVGADGNIWRIGEWGSPRSPR